MDILSFTNPLAYALPLQSWGLQPSLTPALEVTWEDCAAEQKSQHASRHLFCWAQQRLPAGIKEKQGDGGSWGREKLFQPPPPHWNSQLSLVSKRLQHWKTTVRESVTFLALKMLVRTEERTGQTLSHGSPSPQSKGKWIQAGKSALQLPRIAEVSYLFATHSYRLYWWAVSCSEVPPCFKCMRF